MAKGRGAARESHDHLEVAPPRQVQPVHAQPLIVISDDGILNLKALKGAKITELAQMARDFNVDGATNMRKQEMIFSILQAQAARNGSILGEGVLEILPMAGFLRADYNYSPGPDDIYSRRARSGSSTCAPAIVRLIRPPGRRTTAAPGSNRSTEDPESTRQDPVRQPHPFTPRNASSSNTLMKI